MWLGLLMKKVDGCDLRRNQKSMTEFLKEQEEAEGFHNEHKLTITGYLCSPFRRYICSEFFPGCHTSGAIPTSHQSEN
jgi:hypothetical protein